MDQQGPVRGMRGMWVIDHCHTLIHIYKPTQMHQRRGVCQKDYLRSTVGKPGKYVKVESNIWYGGKKEGKKKR